MTQELQGGIPARREPQASRASTTHLAAPERRYLDDVTRRVREALGDAACGVWLFGSAALGDFRRDRSDLDVQAVTTTRPARGTLEELAATLDHNVLPCPARGLEFVLYSRDGLGDAAGPAIELNLNTGRALDRRLSLDSSEDPRFWFVVDVAIGREHGVSLSGPPASAVFPELPRQLVVEALETALDWYESNSGSPTQTLLSACRTWAWASDGCWRSKSASARWASERLADPGPVEAALRARDAPDLPAPRPDQVAAIARLARAALGRHHPGA